MTPPANALNVRLSLARTLTVQIHDGKDWSKTEAAVEWDLPQGVTVTDALADMGKTLDAYLSSISSTAPIQVSGQAKPSEPVKPKLDLSAFNDAKVNSKNGKWIFADSQPALANQVKQAGYSLDVEGGRLTLSKDEKFLTLWGAKK